MTLEKMYRVLQMLQEHDCLNGQILSEPHSYDLRIELAGQPPEAVHNRLRRMGFVYVAEDRAYYYGTRKGT